MSTLVVIRFEGGSRDGLRSYAQSETRHIVHGDGLSYEYYEWAGRADSTGCDVFRHTATRRHPVAPWKRALTVLGLRKPEVVEL